MKLTEKIIICIGIILNDHTIKAKRKEKNDLLMYIYDLSRQKPKDIVCFENVLLRPNSQY